MTRPLFNCVALAFHIFLLLGCSGLGKTENYVPKTGQKPGAELRVGLATNYPPFAFQDAGTLRGVEVDFARQLAYVLNREIEFRELPWDGLIPALVDDRIDVIMSGMSITEARETNVDFVQPYLQIGQMALVRSDEVARYRSPEDLYATRGRVGFEQDTTGEKLARTRMREAQLVPFASVAAGVKALRLAEIDVFIHDAPTIWRIAGNPTERELVGLFWPLTDEFLAWAVRPADTLLLTQLNAVLSAWKENGTLQAILKRWIPVRIEITEQ